MKSLRPSFVINFVIDKKCLNEPIFTLTFLEKEKFFKICCTHHNSMIFDMSTT
jgi:hypothetical protein